MTWGPVVGNVRSHFLEDLYEQCSFHMAEKMPSSVNVGVRPMMSRMRSYSLGDSPCEAIRSDVMVGSVMAVPFGIVGLLRQWDHKGKVQALCFWDQCAVDRKMPGTKARRSLTGRYKSDEHLSIIAFN